MPATLQKSARLACLANLAASALMVAFLVPGLDLSLPSESRLAYIAGHATAWRLSWLCWIGAALSLIYFLISWGEWIERNANGQYRTAVRFGVIVGALGLVPDTIAESLHLGVTRHFAERFASAAPDVTSLLDQFTTWESAITMLTGFLGNGLYCVGGLTLTLVSLKLQRAARGIFIAGLPSWICGFGLSVSALLSYGWGLKVFTALTMAGFVLFSGLLAWRGPEAASE